MNVSTEFRFPHVRLADVSSVVRGSSPRPAGDPRYFNGDFLPWITVADLTRSDEPTLNSTLSHLTEEGADHTRIFEPGTVLLTNSGATLGVPKICGIRAGANDGIAGFLNLSPNLHAHFLYYCLSALTEHLRIKVASGVGQPNLNTELIGDVHVPIPELDEQLKIVQVLSSWDLGIRQLSDLIAAKLRFKHGLMQQLLTGKRRLKSKASRTPGAADTESILKLGLSATAIEVEHGLNGKSYDEGTPKLGDCPSGWQTRRLQDLLTAVQRPVALDPGQIYQLVTARRYRAGIVPREELRGQEIKTSTQFEIKAGDFLISRRQIVHGACGLVPHSLDGAVVSNEYSCIQVCDDLDPLFLEYLSHTKYLQRTFYQSSVGVTVEKMIFRLENWLKYEILIPPLDEQKRIVALLSAIDREIVLLDQQHKTLVKQKKGLMQKLLTGQMRVPNTRKA